MRPGSYGADENRFRGFRGQNRWQDEQSYRENDTDRERMIDRYSEFDQGQRGRYADSRSNGDEDRYESRGGDRPRWGNQWNEGQDDQYGEHQRYSGGGSRGADQNWDRDAYSERRPSYGGEYRTQGNQGSGAYGGRNTYGSRMSGDYGMHMSGGYGSGMSGGQESQYGRQYGSDWSSQRQADGYSGEMNRRRDSSSQGFYGSAENRGGSWQDERSMGNHAGKGPKGWQRSDERLKEEINEALARHPDIDASDIEVQVKNGEVTLTGTVPDRHTKRQAEDAVEQVFGANEVQNQLRVKRQSASVYGDGQSANRGDRGDKSERGDKSARSGSTTGAGTSA